MIVAFTLAPISGIYPVYREAHANAADDARNVEEHRVEWTYHVLEWSYVCTALDVEGQTFAYNLSCRSFATKSNTSLYKNVGCETSIGTELTNAEEIHMLQLEGANCTKSKATERSDCVNCRSPKGVEYRWALVVIYVVLNALYSYHCVTAICKFSYYRRLLLLENRQRVQALRAKILSSAWSVYFCVAFVSALLDLFLVSFFVDLTGCYGLPYWFCMASFAWICPSNFFVTDETRFVDGLPDSVFADGKVDEAELKRLREAQQNYMPQRKSCGLCGR
ncbi:hypothetical protein AAVH_27854 [Aphelenchoides avenae]|nr:hypothetical protein AAVH_27854 [Aphelenchus avenae]